MTETRVLPNHGVSQGAVLSPIIFAACTKYLRRHLPVGYNLSQFSDDAVLWVKVKGRAVNPVVCCHLQLTLQRMVGELLRMGLTVEPQKTAVMLINAKRNSKVSLKLYDEKIPTTKFVKFLGVIVQDNGKWDKQVEKICRRAEGVYAVVRNMCGRN